MQFRSATGAFAMCCPHQGSRTTHTAEDMHALSPGGGTQHGISQHATGGLHERGSSGHPPGRLIVKLPGCVKDKAWCSRLNADAFTCCWTPSGWAGGLVGRTRKGGQPPEQEKVHIAFCRTPKDPAASLPLLQLRAQIKPKIKPGRSCCQQLP